MIEILQEVTDWGKYKIANGVYHVNSAGQLVQHNDRICPSYQGFEYFLVSIQYQNNE